MLQVKGQQIFLKMIIKIIQWRVSQISKNIKTSSNLEVYLEVDLYFNCKASYVAVIDC